MSRFTLASIFRALTGIPGPLPSLAQIEITNLCNLQCPMCVRNFVNLPRRHMDFDVYTRVVDRLAGVHTITLTGYGEPFLHPRILDAIRYAKQRGHEVQLTTNGLLLGNDVAIDDLLDTALDAIAFSVESLGGSQDIGHADSKTTVAIVALLQRRNERGLVTPAVTLQTIMIQGREEDLFAVIRWGASQKVERINVVRFELNTMPGVRRPDIAGERRLFEEFSHLRRKLGIRIDCIQDQVFTGVAAIAYRLGKRLLGMDRRCIRIRDFSYVNVQGDVRPCCALAGHEVGSLIESPMEEIWRNDIYSTFRKKHDKIPWCRRCDTFTLRQKG